MKQLGLLLTFLLAIGFQTVNASDTQAFWADAQLSDVRPNGKNYIKATHYNLQQLDFQAISDHLATAPNEFTANAKDNAIEIALPLPNGDFQQLHVMQTDVMAPELRAKFPNINTFVAFTPDNSVTARLDVTVQGFHAILFTHSGTVYIDPYQMGDTEFYMVYHKHHFVPGPEKEFRCQGALDKFSEPVERSAGPNPIGPELRVYRAAIAATGEYTNFHGGTVNAAISAITTTLNRINGIYEREVGCRMQLVSNNNQIVYTNAGSDPYSNGNAGSMLNQNQSNVNSTIGSGNYDIGHVFGTSGAGLASLGCVCRNNCKAEGVTAIGNPVGDPFDVDYVAHEIGHQFRGNHTWNSCQGGGGSPTEYEPGSASTIMGYAGLCGPDNVQSNSNDYFHVGNFDEIVEYTTTSFGNNCPTVIQTNNNTPVISAMDPTNRTIPISTPFELTAAGSDADGDAITYCWEQHDLGPASNLGSPSGNAPSFRSYPPVSDPVRVFPNIDDLVNNNSDDVEVLPTYTRSFEFRVTARDNNVGGGGVDYDTYNFDATANAGPFLVQSPNNGSESWEVFGNEDVTWDVAGTNSAPVSCSSVDILMSTDGGYTFPITLASGVANDGMETVVPPNNPGNMIRVKVKCSDNIFFDISNNNFSLVDVGNPPPAGIEDATADYLQVMPNPSTGVFFLKWDYNTFSPTYFAVTDGLGRVVHVHSNIIASANATRIDLGHLTKGHYHLIAIGEDERRTHTSLILH